MIGQSVSTQRCPKSKEPLEKRLPGTIARSTLTTVFEADILAPIMKRLLLLILAGSAVLSAAGLEPVKIDTGLVSGTTASSDDVRVFKGIPFAAPPVGDLRWRAPQPAAHWDGVRRAEQFGPVCMQQSRPAAHPLRAKTASM